MSSRKVGGGTYAFHGNAWVGQSNIFADGSVEKHIFLKYDADLASEPGGIDHSKIDPVDENATTFWYVEALDEFCESAFA